MTEYSLIPGHTMQSEMRSVTRYSSSWNSEYPATDHYLVCECGWETEIIGGKMQKEERLSALEHSVQVLGVAATMGWPAP